MHETEYPSCSTHSVQINQIDCRTALGDTASTLAALLESRSGLEKKPMLGEDGGDLVPLALRGEMVKSVTPRWWMDLKEFIKPLAGNDWGGHRRPVMISSSNYGIDGLYALGQTHEAKYSGWATSHSCVEKILAEQGWGDNVQIFSHACVSAQLALYQATHFLNQDLADEVLLLSFDYVGPFVAAGFNSLKILNNGMPAPYKAQAIGSIGLGDGAAYAILSKEGNGPQIKAQVLYNEMYHFTSNMPDGTGFRKTLSAIAPQLEPESFWIKGHGTGTLEPGRLEAESLNQQFPGHPLVSWKGGLGHTLGSCALVELSIALAAAKKGTIPGTVGTKGECYSPDVKTSSFSAKNLNHVLLLSNAFGGAHAAMVVQYA